jgi:N utilization substance protein B
MSQTENNKANKTSIRRDNRMAAIQFLYMWEINPSDSREYGFNQFFEHQEKPREYYSFAEELAQGVLDNLTAIDETIRTNALNWKFERIAKVDLAILRLSIYELLHREDIPPIVTINEAIELSKIFSHEDAKRFINGILDKIKTQLNRPLRKASEE